MFREVAKKNRALDVAECIGILKREPRGVLSVNGDDGYPYGMPMNHFYCEEDGLLYFHCGKYGHRLDAMRRCDKASFCVHDEGYREEGQWSLNIKSVIVFGRIEIIEDTEHAMEMVRRLSYKFTGDKAYIEGEIASSGAHTLVFALRPEHITGKIVNEA